MSNVNDLLGVAAGAPPPGAPPPGAPPPGAPPPGAPPPGLSLQSSVPPQLMRPRPHPLLLALKQQPADNRPDFEHKVGLFLLKSVYSSC